MRPTPFITLRSAAEIKAFLHVLYGAGFNWAGQSMREAFSSSPGIVYTASLFYAAGSGMVYQTGPRSDGTPATPMGRHGFTRVNSAAHLIAYMRETDRLGLDQA